MTFNNLFPFRLASIALFACLTICCQGQSRKDRYVSGKYYYGFKGGATYHWITNISSVIIPPAFNPEVFTTSETPGIGYLGGIYIYHRFFDAAVAIQPEISYGTLNARFEYSDVDDLRYTIDFNYQYLHVGAFLKIYPFSGGDNDKGGFHLAIGPQLSFNMSSEDIKYDSNRPTIGPNLQIQQNLRDVLKGRNLFCVGLGMGYEFPFGMNLEARYYHGLTDAIETQANGYFFTEHDNLTRTVQLTLGYALPFAIH